jgi:hypothetical protein
MCSPSHSQTEGAAAVRLGHVCVVRYVLLYVAVSVPSPYPLPVAMDYHALCSPSK